MPEPCWQVCATFVSALASLQGQETGAQQDLPGIQTILLQADCLPGLLHLLDFASSPLRCQVTHLALLSSSIFAKGFLYEDVLSPCRQHV